MTSEDKRWAEAVLTYLCQGAQINGIRFGPVLSIWIAPPGAAASDPIPGLTNLHLGSHWTVFTERPALFPDSEADLADMTVEEELRTIGTLRELEIVQVELGATQPHLILTLADGQVLFVNGRHPQFECWEVGVAYGDPKEVWLVVACPNGDIASWSPPRFKHQR